MPYGADPLVRCSPCRLADVRSSDSAGDNLLAGCASWSHGSADVNKVNVAHSSWSAGVSAGPVSMSVTQQSCDVKSGCVSLSSRHLTFRPPVCLHVDQKIVHSTAPLIVYGWYHRLLEMLCLVACQACNTLGETLVRVRRMWTSVVDREVFKKHIL